MSSFPLFDRLERRVDKIDDELELVKVSQHVDDARLNELEAFRRRDEPRIAELVNAAKVASEVRKVLHDQRQAMQRRRLQKWTRLQKTAAAFAGAVALLAAVSGADQGIHILVHLLP